MHMRTPTLKDVKLTEGFWKSRTDMIAESLIPYQWDALNNRIPGAPESHAVENFRIAAGEAEGRPEGIIFHDSDIAKWIEAASYVLSVRPNAELEAIIDELIRLIAKSQKSDGYVNTYFIAEGDEHRWSDLKMGHELYCAGHMMEAAVAYFKATGKRKLLEVMCRFADYIGEVFGPNEGQNHSYGGHPEIELALYRLADATKNRRYEELAEYFINIRGTVENYHIGETADPGMNHDNKWFREDYFLAHEPVRGMRTADGHAVRAVYLYTAMTDLALRQTDDAMVEALGALWRNLTRRRMYITAGIGPQGRGERFTVDYDLPSDTGYTETCAAVGLVFWAWRMTLLNPAGEYGDVIERALFNGALSGMSLDGTKYFYVNPLEINPAIAEYRYDHDHVKTARVPWFDCACCPTNIARLVSSVSQYFFSRTDKEIWLHQYASGEYGIELEEESLNLIVKTDYPWDGRIRIFLMSSSSSHLPLHLRIPAWCEDFTLALNGEILSNPGIENGFVTIERLWEKNDEIELVLKMSVLFIRAHGDVVETAGKIAVQRGPLIYCLEEQDNGPGLHRILIDIESEPTVLPDDTLLEGGRIVVLDGFREEKDTDEILYRPYEKNRGLKPCRIRAIPYFQWGNRGQNQEMRVWIRSIK